MSGLPVTLSVSDYVRTFMSASVLGKLVVRQIDCLRCIVRCSEPVLLFRELCQTVNLCHYDYYLSS